MLAAGEAMREQRYRALRPVWPVEQRRKFKTLGICEN
jgi:hypothetical protein